MHYVVDIESPTASNYPFIYRTILNESALLQLTKVNDSN